MIKAIFWDNDGILVDTERLYFLATQRVLATVGVSLTKDQYIELFLVQGKGAWHLAAETGVSPSAIEQLRHARNTLYSTLLCQEPLIIAGVQQVLDALHETYVMGIVTGSEQDHFALIHQTPHLPSRFKTGDRIWNSSSPDLLVDMINRRHEFLSPLSVPGVKEIHLDLMSRNQSCEQHPSPLTTAITTLLSVGSRARSTMSRSPELMPEPIIESPRTLTKKVAASCLMRCWLRSSLPSR